MHYPECHSQYLRGQVVHVLHKDSHHVSLPSMDQGLGHPLKVPNNALHRLCAQLQILLGLVVTLPAGVDDSCVLEERQLGGDNAKSKSFVLEVLVLVLSVPAEEGLSEGRLFLLLRGRGKAGFQGRARVSTIWNFRLWFFSSRTSWTR